MQPKIEPSIDHEALHETPSRKRKLPEDLKPEDDLVCGGRSEKKRKQHKKRQSYDLHDKVIRADEFKTSILILSRAIIRRALRS